MVDKDNKSKVSPVVRTSGNCNQSMINVIYVTCNNEGFYFLNFIPSTLSGGYSTYSKLLLTHLQFFEIREELISTISV